MSEPRKFFPVPIPRAMFFDDRAKLPRERCGAAASVAGEVMGVLGRYTKGEIDLDYCLRTLAKWEPLHLFAFEMGSHDEIKCLRCKERRFWDWRSKAWRRERVKETWTMTIERTFPAPPPRPMSDTAIVLWTALRFGGQRP